MVRSGHGQPGHAVVAVAQELDPEAVALLKHKISLDGSEGRHEEGDTHVGELVEPGEEVIEYSDQLLGLTRG